MAVLSGMNHAKLLKSRLSKLLILILIIGSFSLFIRLKFQSNISILGYPENCGTSSEISDIKCRVAKAQRNKDLKEVENQVKAWSLKLGDKIGVPERKVEYINTFEQFENPNTEIAYGVYLDRLQQDPWWLKKPQPFELNQDKIVSGLRDLANIIEGNLFAIEAGSQDSDLLLQNSKDIAEYLIWAQDQAGSGVYPFPVVPNRT